MKAFGLVGLVAVALLAPTTHCSPPARDFVPETHETRGTPSASTSASTAADGYVYAAKRAHGAVGLVGARNISDDDARKIVDRAADDMEACMRRLETEGSLVEGAASFVAIRTSDGSPRLNDVRISPGAAVARVALLCLVAPIRSQFFPAGTGEAPVVGIEASWGRVSAPKP